MIKYLYFTILFLFCGVVKGQTIEGTVYHESETVPFANILIRKVDNPDLVYQFASSNGDGYYKIQLETSFDSIWIEVHSISFEPQKKLLKKIVKGEKYIENFSLKERTTELKEIVIEKELPVVVKNDTTTYNPEAFKDGTERVVEDLLKKLPGIKVEESGEIKFKGKSIKKILLDGDDLFNSQYTIGSKNINVNIVDKVQAIENFEENVLLKGLVNSDEVVLNLQLKKGKADFSGDASLGYGYNERYNSRLTGLLVSKKAKGFLTAAYNNTGNNYSPYNFRSTIIKTEPLSNLNLEVSELIMQGDFYSQIEDKYHRVNNNIYSNANFLYKFSPKMVGKINLGIYDDKLTRENKLFTEYNIGNDYFKVNQVDNIVKKPRLYNASMQFSQTFKDSLAWEYIGKVNYHEVSFENHSLNNDLVQQNKIKTINFFTKHDLSFTGRINKNSAITAKGLFSKSRAPQRFLLSPGLNFEEEYTGDILQNNQLSRFDKQVLNLKVEYYQKINNVNWKTIGSFTSIDNGFESLLTAKRLDGEVFSDINYANALEYNYRLPALTTGISYMYNKKMGFGASIGVQNYSFRLNDNLRKIYKKESDWVLSPSLKLLYVINKKENLLAAYSYSEIAPNETSLFEGVVMTGYRSFRNNIPDFQFLKTHTYNINYGYNDFFNLTRFSIMFTHNNRENNYFYKNIINAENTITTAFLANVGNKDYNMFFDGEKYIHFLRSTIQLNSGYTLSFDKNIINNSDLRDIQLRYFTLGVTVRTGFKSKFDFENKLDYLASEYLLESIGQNNFKSLTDTFKIIYKLENNLKANAILNFISPNLSENNNYWFLDTELRFTSKNKKIDYTLTGRNLTNNKRVQSVSISDYSKTISSHNLIERYILFSVDFRF